MQINTTSDSLGIAFWNDTSYQLNLIGLHKIYIFFNLKFFQFFVITEDDKYIVVSRLLFLPFSVLGLLEKTTLDSSDLGTNT